MSVVNFIYNDQEIAFEPTGKDDVMVNATQMAKIFGKRVDVFLKADHVKEFIKVMELTQICGSSDDELTPYGGSSRDKIIRGENGNATFFHRILALKFVAWLDPKFELWVFTTIDKILNEYYRNHRERLEVRETLKAELKVEKELLKNDPKYIKVLDLERRIRDIDNASKVETRKEVKRIQLELIF